MGAVSTANESPPPIRGQGPTRNHAAASANDLAARARLPQGPAQHRLLCGRPDLGAMLLWSRPRMILHRPFAAKAPRGTMPRLRPTTSPRGRASHRGRRGTACFVGGPTSGRCFLQESRVDDGAASSTRWVRPNRDAACPQSAWKNAARLSTLRVRRSEGAPPTGAGAAPPALWEARPRGDAFCREVGWMTAQPHPRGGSGPPGTPHAQSAWKNAARLSTLRVRRREGAPPTGSGAAPPALWEARPRGDALAES